MCDHCPVFDHKAHLERAWELGMMEPDEPMPRGSLPANHPDSYENVQGRLGEIAVCKALSNAGIPHFDDVYLPWGKNGYTQVDHIALVGSTFVAVETKNWKGTMTRDAEGRKIYRIVKGAVIPLGDVTLQNRTHIQALKEFLKTEMVTGIVVLPALFGYASYEDHLPEGHTRVTEAGEDIRDLGKGTEPNAESLTGWRMLEMFHTDGDYVSKARRVHGAKFTAQEMDPSIMESRDKERSLRLAHAKHLWRDGPRVQNPMALNGGGIFSW